MIIYTFITLPRSEVREIEKRLIAAASGKGMHSRMQKTYNKNEILLIE